MTSVRRGAARMAAWVVLGVAALIVLPAVPASAHAELIGSNPKDGSSVKTLPSQVELEFSEEIGSPAFVEVKAADGTDVTAGDPEVLGAKVTVPLAASGPSGEYTIDYRVVSADGHPVSEELTFDVTSGSGPTAAATSPASSTASSSTDDESFFSRHKTHFLVAGLGIIAGALLVGMGLRARR
jgi:copper resistance protein C